jgi:diadenosine tetraphosphate (Ap4A) HIT family hydrolase
MRMSKQVDPLSGESFASSTSCKQCGFDLWLPILGMRSSEIGLYSDARFPGRCIVTLREHYDHISDVPAMDLVTFMEEIKFAVDAIQRATDCPRVNVAILGNAESHVHAHLIPRNPKKEPLPNKAPWEDPRPRGSLPEDKQDQLIEDIRLELVALLKHSKYPAVFLSGARKRVRSGLPTSVDVPLFDLLSDSQETV